MTTKTDAPKTVTVTNVKHPFRDYDTTEALRLATDLKYGLFHQGHKEPPTVKEAIKLFEEAPTMKACNWITGQTALQVLKAADGEEVAWT